MGDERVQRAFDIVRHVFTPRQFDDDGMNLQTMKIEYYLRILRHFWPDRVRPALDRKASGLIRRLNSDSADLLDEICDFVESRDGLSDPATARFAADLLSHREAFDAKALPRARAILAEIRRLGAAGAATSRGRLTGAASIAAAALLATTVGCSNDGWQATEMAPPPNKGPKDVAAQATRPNPCRPTRRCASAVRPKPAPTETAFEEMAPEPFEKSVPTPKAEAKPALGNTDAPPVVEAVFQEEVRTAMMEMVPMPTGTAAPTWTNSIQTVTTSGIELWYKVAPTDTAHRPERLRQPARPNRREQRRPPAPIPNPPARPLPRRRPQSRRRPRPPRRRPRPRRMRRRCPRPRRPPSRPASRTPTRRPSPPWRRG